MTTKRSPNGICGTGIRSTVAILSVHFV